MGLPKIAVPEYSLKLPHPDHPEIDASVTSGNYTKTNSTGPTDKDGTVALDKDAGPSGNDESGSSGASGASSSGPESPSDLSN